MREKVEVWQGTLALMVFEDAGNPGPGTRLWHRAPDRADQRPAIADQLRHALPCPPKIGAGRIYRFGMGRIR